jgi:PAS domain S-box-containing protein
MEEKNKQTGLCKICIDKIPDILITLNKEGRIITINKAIKGMLGYKKEDILGKQFINYIVKDDLKRFEDELQYWGEKEKEIRIPISIEAKDKKILHFELHGCAVFDENDELEYVQGVLRDISTREEMVKQLEKKNKEIHLLAKKSTLLQETLNVEETIQIALETFVEFGFERVRLYSYDEEKNMLKGVRNIGTDNEVFKKLKLVVGAQYQKAYRCLNEKRPVIDRRKNLSKFRKILNKEDLRESASLPLISKGKVMGMISLDNKYSKRPIDQKELEELMTITNQIAVAIENSELYAERNRQIERLSVLYDVAKTSSVSLQLEKILSLIVVRIAKLMKADVCSLLLPNESGERLVPDVVYSPNDPHILFEKTILTEKSLSGHVLKTQKEKFVPDIKEDKYYQNRNFAAKNNLKTVLSVPLIAEEKALGVLNIYTKKEKTYSKRARALISTLANQAAIIIRNAKLYQQIKEDKERLSAVLEITQAITSTLKFEELLNLIMRKIVTFTKADRGIIGIVEGDKLIFKEGIGYDVNKIKRNIKTYEGSSGWVIKNKQPLIIDDTSKDSPRIALDFPAKSEATIPLIVKGNVIGIINLESRYTHNFSHYKGALTLLTNLIAIAVENATLYDNIQDFNENLKAEVERATRELREKNEALKKLDKLKSDFVSNVSHELRTPLTSIAGYAKLLHREEIGEINDDQKESLGIIVEEADRLTRLINDVLDLSKLESGKVKYKFEEIDIRDIAEIVRETLLVEAAKKGIAINMNWPDLLPRVNGNKDLLKQVFINLLNNAIKFTENGSILVHMRKIGESVEVEVKDTGIGISEEEQKRLFRKFHQVDSSTSRKYSGTGLGLSIVKHIIDDHQGEVRVISELGKGTSFIFTVPITNNKDTPMSSAVVQHA